MPFFKNKCYVDIIKKPIVVSTIGWLEERIFFALSNKNPQDFSVLLYHHLKIIFNGDQKFINPGKAYLLESLKNQNCNFFKFDVYVKYLTRRVKVHSPNALFRKHCRKDLGNDIDDNLKLKIINEVVKDVLQKFKDSGD